MWERRIILYLPSCFCLVVCLVAVILAMAHDALNIDVSHHGIVNDEVSSISSCSEVLCRLVRCSHCLSPMLQVLQQSVPEPSHHNLSLLESQPVACIWSAFINTLQQNLPSVLKQDHHIDPQGLVIVLVYYYNAQMQMAVAAWGGIIHSYHPNGWNILWQSC